MKTNESRRYVLLYLLGSVLTVMVWHEVDTSIQIVPTWQIHIMYSVINVVKGKIIIVIIVIM